MPRPALCLYRALLRRQRELVYTDKAYIQQRIRAEFEKNRHLTSKEEIKKCLEKGQEFLRTNALV